MKIESGKRYQVWKYFMEKDNVENYGFLMGEDVKRILKGYKFDERYDLWFSNKAVVAYNVEEAD